MKSSTSVVELVMLLCSQVRHSLGLIVLVSLHSVGLLPAKEFYLDVCFILPFQYQKIQINLFW